MISVIANATLESGTQVTYLAQENELLKAQVSNMQKLLAKMQETSIAKDKTSSSKSTKTSNKNMRKSNKPRGYDPNSKYYCWSHGLTRIPYHTSNTCREPEPGHDKTATFSNRKNGSNNRCHHAASATNDGNGTVAE